MREVKGQRQIEFFGKKLIPQGVGIDLFIYKVSVIMDICYL